MWVKNIKIVNFRNFSRLNLDFSPRFNIFEGGNSQGKTNLIEALYCLGRGVSFRTFEDQKLIKWNQSSFYLAGEGERKDNLLRYELSLAKNSFKLRHVNSHRVSLKNTTYWLWMVVFSTQDLKMVQGGPFHRRHFLDEVASFIYPNFLHLRSSFNQVLNQRNTLLGRMRGTRASYGKEMIGWDAQFLRLGSELVYLRLKGLRALASKLSAPYTHLMGSVRSVHLVYNSSFLDAGDVTSSLENIGEKFHRRLEAAKEKEIERGISLLGPHRDDFQITVDGVDQRTFGSQGEQRTAAIALRLAEVELVREKENEYPIILLDDIPSDLDPQREKYLLQVVKDKGQVFVATQDVARLDRTFLDKSYVVHIRDGRVVSK